MPYVEDITSDIVAKSAPCRHKVLFFGSGGYYLICTQCSAMWVAKDPMSDDPDRNYARTDLTSQDFRVDPKATVKP